MAQGTWREDSEENRKLQEKYKTENHTDLGHFEHLTHEQALALQDAQPENPETKRMSGLTPTKEDMQWYRARQEDRQEKSEQEQWQQWNESHTTPAAEWVMDKAMGLAGYAFDLAEAGSDSVAGQFLGQMLQGLSDADHLVKEGYKLTPGGGGEHVKTATEITEAVVSLGGSSLLRNAPKLARKFAQGGADDLARANQLLQKSGVGQATLATLQEGIDRIPPMGPQLQVSLAGVGNLDSYVKPRMQQLQPPTVMKYSDEQLATLGTGPSNKSTLEGLDPKYRYFDEQSLRDMQGPMTDREPLIRKAEQLEAQWVTRLDEALESGDKRAIKYARKKLKEARRKANDLISNPPEEIVPNNPQTYHSSPAAKAARDAGGVDAAGNPRIDLHHQTIENTEAGRLFRRKKVLSESPQGGILYWEHLRRLGIIPGGGSRNMRALSGPQHTGLEGIHEFPAFKRWRGFFENLPDNISLNDLFKKTDEFAASLDDTDKFFTSIGDPLLDRNIPEGVLLQNQTERLIKDVQDK